MKKVWLPIVFAVSAPMAVASDRVDITQDASADGFVRITLVRGDLEIEGWNRNQVQVKGELDDQTEEFIFDVSGGDTVIEVKLPRNIGWNSGTASDLEIKVPVGSNVDVSGVSTDIRIANIEGGLEIGGVSGNIDIRDIQDRVDATTVSGDLEVRDIAGRISLKAVSGDIDVEKANGDFRMATVSGDVVGRDLVGEFDLESVSGDIELMGGKFSGIEGHTVSGDVDVSSEMEKGSTIELDTVSGTVRIEFVGKIDAEFDLETSSGSIRNRITSDRAETSKYVRDETLRFVVGNGDGEVIVSSRSGDIIVDRD